jgi:hypothetical protein
MYLYLTKKHDKGSKKMKKYTRRRVCGRYGKRKTRSRRGSGSKRPTPAPTPAPTPTPRQSARQSSRISAPPPPQSRAPSRASTAPSRSASAKPTPGLVVFKNGVSLQPLRSAGISKDDTQALQAARLVSNFPYDMDKFLYMVVNNYELLNYEGVKLALREKISINEDPAVGRLSTNGILFISYICGKLVCLLNELSTLPKSNVGKKRSLLYRIKQIERVICLLDGVGCSWGIRPYSKTEMDNIAEYYRKIKDDAGLQEYHQQLNEFINKYFPVLTKYTDPSHVVSSSMCRRLIPHHIMSRIDE